MSPEEKTAAALAAMFSVGNPIAAAVVLEAAVENMASTLLAFVRPEHHAEMLRVMARGASSLIARQDAEVVKEAGELLKLYRKHDKGAAS